MGCPAGGAPLSALGLVGRPWAAGHAATGLQAYKDSLRAKVNVSTPPRRRPSLQGTQHPDPRDPDSKTNLVRRGAVAVVLRLGA